MLPIKVLKTPLLKEKTNVITTVHFTDDDVSFYDSPRMLIRKTAKPCFNSK